MYSNQEFDAITGREKAADCPKTSHSYLLRYLWLAELVGKRVGKGLAYFLHEPLSIKQALESSDEEGGWFYLD